MLFSGLWTLGLGFFFATAACFNLTFVHLKTLITSVRTPKQFLVTVDVLPLHAGCKVISLQHDSNIRRLTKSPCSKLQLKLIWGFGVGQIELVSFTVGTNSPFVLPCWWCFWAAGEESQHKEGILNSEDLTNSTEASLALAEHECSSMDFRTKTRKPTRVPNLSRWSRLSRGSLTGRCTETTSAPAAKHFCTQMLP